MYKIENLCMLNVHNFVHFLKIMYTECTELKIFVY